MRLERRAARAAAAERIADGAADEAGGEASSSGSTDTYILGEYYGFGAPGGAAGRGTGWGRAGPPPSGDHVRGVTDALMHRKPSSDGNHQVMFSKTESNGM